MAACYCEHCHHPCFQLLDNLLNNPLYCHHPIQQYQKNQNYHNLTLMTHYDYGLAFPQQ